MRLSLGAVHFTSEKRCGLSSMIIAVSIGFCCQQAFGGAPTRESLTTPTYERTKRYSSSSTGHLCLEALKRVFLDEGKKGSNE